MYPCIPAGQEDMGIWIKLKHWDRGGIPAILQRTVSNWSFCMRIVSFWCELHWNLFQGSTYGIGMWLLWNQSPTCPNASVVTLNWMRNIHQSHRYNTIKQNKNHELCIILGTHRNKWMDQQTKRSTRDHCGSWQQMLGLLVRLTVCRLQCVCNQIYLFLGVIILTALRYNWTMWYQYAGSMPD